MSTYGNPPPRQSAFGTENTSKFDKASHGLLDTGVIIEERMERGKEQGRRVLESVKKGAVAVKDKMAHLDRENVRTNLRRAQSYAKENPGKVVLASLALGWIAGALRRRGNGKVKPVI